MGYTPPLGIDVGNDPGSPNETTVVTNSYICKENPANRSGVITEIKVYISTNCTSLQLAVFSKSGLYFTSHGWVNVGAVSAGAIRTFSGLSLSVTAGDYIGFYDPNGTIGRYSTGGSGYWWLNTEDGIPCTNKLWLDYSSLPRKLFIYGTGESGDGVLTIGDSFASADSLVKSGTEQLAEAVSVVDSKVTSIAIAVAEAFSAVDSWAARLSFPESFAITDSITKGAVKNVTEAWQVVDSLAYTVILYFNETLQVVDSYKRFFYNLYSKVSKTLSNYTKVIKNIATYTKRSKDVSSYRKIDKPRGEE